MLRLARAALVGVEEEENTFVAEHRRSPHILGKGQMAAPSGRANASAFCAHATLHCSSSRSSRPAWAAASKLSARPQTQFADVIGSDEAKAKAGLNRVKALRHDPTHCARLGASAPRGVLLVGPPGTGKTLLAEALAGESKTNFIAVDGSYFTAMFYGAGVSKVKELFKLARKNAPWVLFIDEVDGLGKRSPGGQGGGAESELNRIINRVRVEMDGFDSLGNVVVVAATNHEDNIDPAMRRPGRFDLLVRLALPTLPDRQQLFDLYIGKLSHEGMAVTAALARMTAGLTPADIANTVNKAASRAAEAGAQRVPHEHFLRAIETHQLGGEVSAVKGLLSESTRERLASRGTEDPLYAQDELSNRLAMVLGGREAKLLVKGSVSSGTSDDLKRASDLAINMVGSLGFSKTFGLLSVAGVPKELLGCDIQAALLKEARGMLEKARAQCEQLLTSRRWQLDALAQALSQREVLCGDELRGCWRSVRDRPPELRIWHDRPSAMRRGTNEDLRNDLYRPPGETCWAI